MSAPMASGLTVPSTSSAFNFRRCASDSCRRPLPLSCQTDRCTACSARSGNNSPPLFQFFGENGMQLVHRAADERRRSVEVPQQQRRQVQVQQPAKHIPVPSHGTISSQDWARLTQEDQTRMTGTFARQIRPTVQWPPDGIIPRRASGNTIIPVPRHSGQMNVPRRDSGHTIIPGRPISRQIGQMVPTNHSFFQRVPRRVSENLNISGTSAMGGRYNGQMVQSPSDSGVPGRINQDIVDLNMTQSLQPAPAVPSNYRHYVAANMENGVASLRRSAHELRERSSSTDSNSHRRFSNPNTKKYREQHKQQMPQPNPFTRNPRPLPQRQYANDNHTPSYNLYAHAPPPPPRERAPPPVQSTTPPAQMMYYPMHPQFQHMQPPFMHAHGPYQPVPSSFQPAFANAQGPFAPNVHPPFMQGQFVQPAFANVRGPFPSVHTQSPFANVQDPFANFPSVIPQQQFYGQPNNSAPPAKRSRQDGKVHMSSKPSELQPSPVSVDERAEESRVTPFTGGGHLPSTFQLGKSTTKGPEPSQLPTPVATPASLFSAFDVCLADATVATRDRASAEPQTGTAVDPVIVSSPPSHVPFNEQEPGFSAPTPSRHNQVYLPFSNPNAVAQPKMKIAIPAITQERPGVEAKTGDVVYSPDTKEENTFTMPDVPDLEFAVRNALAKAFREEAQPKLNIAIPTISQERPGVEVKPSDVVHLSDTRQEDTFTMPDVPPIPDLEIAVRNALVKAFREDPEIQNSAFFLDNYTPSRSSASSSPATPLKFFSRNKKHERWTPQVIDVDTLEDNAPIPIRAVPNNTTTPTTTLVRSADYTDAEAYAQAVLDQRRAPPHPRPVFGRPSSNLQASSSPAVPPQRKIYTCDAENCDRTIGARPGRCMKCTMKRWKAIGQEEEPPPLTLTIKIPPRKSVVTPIGSETASPAPEMDTGAPAPRFIIKIPPKKTIAVGFTSQNVPAVDDGSDTEDETTVTSAVPAAVENIIPKTSTIVGRVEVHPTVSSEADNTVSPPLKVPSKEIVEIVQVEGDMVLGQEMDMDIFVPPHPPSDTLSKISPTESTCTALVPVSQVKGDAQPTVPSQDMDVDHNTGVPPIISNIENDISSAKAVDIPALVGDTPMEVDQNEQNSIEDAPSSPPRAMIDPISGWDSDLSDYTAEDDESVTPDPGAPSGLKIRIRIPKAIVIDESTRYCNKRSCRAPLRPTYKWKSCSNCRVMAREYQRARQGTTVQPDKDLTLNNHSSNYNMVLPQTQPVDAGTGVLKSSLPLPAASSSSSQPASDLELDGRHLSSNDNSINPLTGLTNRQCSIKHCHCALPPIDIYKWRLCADCRANKREASRRRKYPENIPTEGMVLCSTSGCGALVKPNGDIRQCTNCLDRAVEFLQKKLSGLNSQTQTPPSTASFIRPHPGPPSSLSSAPQKSTSRPPSPLTKQIMPERVHVQRIPVHRYPQYQSGDRMIETFIKRLIDFLNAQMLHLAFWSSALGHRGQVVEATARKGIPDQENKSKDDTSTRPSSILDPPPPPPEAILLRTKVAVSAFMQTPPVSGFSFDGEYSKIIRASDLDVLQREKVEAAVHKLTKQLEKSVIGLNINATGWTSVVEKTGIVTRFRVAHITGFPADAAASKIALPAGGNIQLGPSSDDPNTVALRKTMVGELEIAIIPDYSHAFIPGERTVVRFRLAG